MLMSTLKLHCAAWCSLPRSSFQCRQTRLPAFTFAQVTRWNSNSNAVMNPQNLKARSSISTQPWYLNFRAREKPCLHTRIFFGIDLFERNVLQQKEQKGSTMRLQKKYILCDVVQVCCTTHKKVRTHVFHCVLLRSATTLPGSTTVINTVKSMRTASLSFKMPAFAFLILTACCLRNRYWTFWPLHPDIANKTKQDNQGAFLAPGPMDPPQIARLQILSFRSATNSGFKAFILKSSCVLMDPLFERNGRFRLWKPSISQLSAFLFEMSVSLLSKLPCKQLSRSWVSLRSHGNPGWLYISSRARSADLSTVRIEQAQLRRNFLKHLKHVMRHRKKAHITQPWYLLKRARINCLSQLQTKSPSLQWHVLVPVQL